MTGAIDRALVALVCSVVMSRSLIDPPVGEGDGTVASAMNQRFKPTRPRRPQAAYRYWPGGGASCAVAAARARSRSPSATALAWSRLTALTSAIGPALETSTV